MSAVAWTMPGARLRLIEEEDLDAVEIDAFEAPGAPREFPPAVEAQLRSMPGCSIASETIVLLEGPVGTLADLIELASHIAPWTRLRCYRCGLAKNCEEHATEPTRAQVLGLRTRDAAGVELDDMQELQMQEENELPEPPPSGEHAVLDPAEAFAAARRAPLREVAAVLGTIDAGRIICPNCGRAERTHVSTGNELSCGTCNRKNIDAIGLVRRAKTLKGDQEAVDFLIRTFGTGNASASSASPWAARVVEVPDDWYRTAPPPRVWLLRDRRTGHGVLPAGKVACVSSEGGGGKTMAAMQFAIATVTGGTWLGALDVARRGRVLGIFGEEDAEELHRRVYHAARAMRVAPPDPGMLIALPLSGLPSAMIQRDGSGNATDAPFLDWLRKRAAEVEDLALIIVDPLSRFAGADAEKDNAQATRFVEALESLANATGATVLVAHHTSQAARNGAKLTASSSRGVTGLVDGVRWVATMAVEHVDGLSVDSHARLGEIVTFAFAKSNYSRKGEPILLRRDHDHGGALVPLDETDEEIIAEARRVAAPPVRRATERAKRVASESADVEGAIASLLRDRAGLTCRELRALVSTRLEGCSAQRVDAALDRLLASRRVRREGAKHTGFKHYLSEVTP